MNQVVKTLVVFLWAISMSGCASEKTVHEIEEEIRGYEAVMWDSGWSPSTRQYFRDQIKALKKQKKELLRRQNNRPPEPVLDPRKRRVHQLQAILDDWNVPPPPAPAINMDWDAERLDASEAKLMEEMVNSRAGKKCTGNISAWLKISPADFSNRDLGILTCGGNNTVFYFIMDKKDGDISNLLILEKSEAVNKYPLLKTVEAPPTGD